MAPADGGAAAVERMKARAARLRNLAPALKVFAEEIHKATDDSFEQSRDVLGRPFKPLAQSTLDARGRRVKGGRAKSRKAGTKGRLTPAAVAKRAAAAGSHKPLVDTARARNSQRAAVRGAASVRWSAVGYLEPHIRGLGVPKRNPTVFAADAKGAPVLLAPYARRLSTLITSYVETGKAA